MMGTNGVRVQIKDSKHKRRGGGETHFDHESVSSSAKGKKKNIAIPASKAIRGEV